MNLDILRKVGLSEGEIKVYNAVLGIGIAPINKIHEKTGIERRNIYDILNKLIERGLVTYMNENKKRSFQISSPNRLLEYIDEKKEAFEDIKKKLSLQMPEILKEFQAKNEDIKAEVFRGVEGIKTVWNDMLNYSEMFWIGSGRYVPKRYPNFFIPWNKRRIKKRIKVFNLLRYEMRGQIEVWTYEKVKYLPKEFSGTPAVIGIFGNKIAHFLYGENLFAFVIESKELAENYKSYHKYLWDKVARP